MLNNGLRNVLLKLELFYTQLDSSYVYRTRTRFNLKVEGYSVLNSSLKSIICQLMFLLIGVANINVYFKII